MRELDGANYTTEPIPPQQTLGEAESMDNDHTIRPLAERDTRAVRVALVDDHPPVRAGLAAILADKPGVQVVATAATAAEGYEHITREQPDVAILDYNLPGEDGVSLCHRLKVLPAPPRVLILSAFADDALVLMGLVAGADGILSKGATADLTETVAALSAGEHRIQEITPMTLHASGAKLDGNDLPILGMLLHGVPTAEIAETLDITPAWLAARRWGMLEKLRDRRPRRARLQSPGIKDRHISPTAP